jgi:hypothetical protein
MKFTIPFVVAAAVLATHPALAQESAAHAGRIEATAFPGGGLFFTDTDAETDFGTFALGGSVTYNLGRFAGVEGEVGGDLGVHQTLAFGGGNLSAKPPNTLAYNGNVLVYPGGNDRAFAPYATGGVGGLTLLEQSEVGVNDTTTFLTGNVGGGVKYYISPRWGIRGDYRFFATRSKDDAPAFFGRETRYGHRVYGGVVFNLAR